MGEIPVGHVQHLLQDKIRQSGGIFKTEPRHGRLNRFIVCNDGGKPVRRFGEAFSGSFSAQADAGDICMFKTFHQDQVHVPDPTEAVFETFSPLPDFRGFFGRGDHHCRRPGLGMPEGILSGMIYFKPVAVMFHDADTDAALRQQADQAFHGSGFAGA